MSQLPSIRALIIPVDGKPRVEPVEMSVAAYQRIIGGAAERHRPCDTWQVWYSDMFRVTGADVNPLANNLVRRVDPDFSVLFRGPVMIVGTNVDGSDVDVPDELLRDAKVLVTT